MTPTLHCNANRNTDPAFSALPVMSRFPAWVRHTNDFQQYALLNKAVLDIFGVDVPMIALARNKNERKEVLFRQTVILLAAFVFAPVHALLFRTHFARLGRFPSKLMQVSFENLKKLSRLKVASKEQFPRNTFLVTEALRRRVVQAKSNMLTWDLMVEGLIFANLGYIKNWFGKLITGKNQFTGEMGVVSEQALDTMYRRRAHTKTSFEKIAPFIPSALAIIAPVMLGRTVMRAALRPQVSPLMQWFRKRVQWFDYKRGYIMSLAPLGVIGLLNDFGDIIAARSPHERREMFLKRLPVTVTFFAGDLVWMKLLSALFLKKLGLPATSLIEKAIQSAPQRLKKQAGMMAARLYWASFLLNTATVAGVITFNNWLTTKKVKIDAGKLSPQGLP